VPDCVIKGDVLGVIALTPVPGVIVPAFSSRVWPKPFTVGAVTAGPFRSCHLKLKRASSPAPVTAHSMWIVPFSAEKAPYFAAIGCEFVQDQGKCLYDVGVKHDVGATDMEPVWKRGKLCGYNLAEGGAAPVAVHENIVCTRERLQTLLNQLTRIGGAAAIRYRARNECAYDGHDVLDPVVELAKQELLTFTSFG
jgi:hypothetical protein